MTRANVKFKMNGRREFEKARAKNQDSSNPDYKMALMATLSGLNLSKSDYEHPPTFSTLQRVLMTSPFAFGCFNELSKCRGTNCGQVVPDSISLTNVIPPRFTNRPDNPDLSDASDVAIQQMAGEYVLPTIFKNTLVATICIDCAGNNPANRKCRFR